MKSAEFFKKHAKPAGKKKMPNGTAGTKKRIGKTSGKVF